MKKKMHALAMGATALAILPAIAAPTLSNVKIVKLNRQVMEMAYTLSDGPAIVMLNVTTNGVSIGGENLASITGSVNTIVSGDTRHSFTWFLKDAPMAVEGIPFDADVKLVCRPLENPPDYMIVNLAENLATPRFTFAERASDLAGGLTNNAAYWTDKLVMKRIRARNIPWTMGCQPFAEGAMTGGGFGYDRPHEVTLTNDYWAAVFQLTRGQWMTLTQRGCPGQYKFSDRRPVDSVRIESTDTGTVTKWPALRGDQTDACRYPSPPHEMSMLGILRTRTGLAFDLPGEAMWEYAARAGTVDEHWGDGTPSHDASLPGRYKDNGGLVNDAAPDGATAGVECATAEVGTYAPNLFGLYDVHGNGFELCLDWFEIDIGTLNGAINADGGKTLSGKTGEGNVKKGGWIGSGRKDCLASSRFSVAIGSGGRAEVCRLFIHSIDPRLAE